MLCPPELVGEILSHLCDTPLIDASSGLANPPLSSTLSTCMRVSRLFHAEALPLLYSRIEMVAGLDGTSERAAQLENTLQTNPELADFVRSFTTKVISEETSPSEGEDITYDNPALSAILPLFKELELLTFEYDDRLGPLWWTNVASPLRAAIAQALAGNQRQFALRLTRFSIPQRLYLLNPHLTSVYISGTPNVFHDDDFEVTTFRTNIAEIQSFRSLMSLDHIASTSALRSTRSATIFAVENDMKQRDQELENFLDATQHHLASLKLCLSYGGNVTLNRPPPCMRGLKNLELHWELDDYLPEDGANADGTAEISGFFTLVLGLLFQLLNNGTPLETVSLHVIRRCAFALDTVADKWEEDSLCSALDAAFGERQAMAPTLRELSLNVTHVCESDSGCDNCRLFDRRPGEGMLDYLGSNDKFAFSYTHVKLSDVDYPILGEYST